MFLSEKKQKTSSCILNIRNMQFDQSSPVHPVSDFKGGPLSVTQEEEED